MRIVCLYFQNPAPIEEIAEACYRWTPQIALRTNEALFLEIERCHRLYNEQTLIARLQILLKRFKVSAKVAITDDAFMSLAWAKYSKAPVFRLSEEGSESALLPLQALTDIASPFKNDEALNKNIFEMISELESLGLRTLGDFLKLPIKELASRFQRQGLELHRRLQNGNFDESLSLWPRFIPPEHIKERADLDYYSNCQTLEPLLFVIKGLVSRAMARLAGRGERLSKALLHFELEKHSTVKNTQRSWIFDLPLSQGLVTGLLPLIQERLGFELTREPLQSSVVKVSFEVLETVPGQYFQRHFFNKKEEEQEAWNSLITRLCEKLGRKSLPSAHSAIAPCAFVAEAVQSYKPEKSWRKTIKERTPDEEGQITGDLPLPERPLRLLKKPERLRKEGNLLLSASRAQSQWEISEWEGPERLSGEWWGEEFKRDYFRIATTSGEQLWVFRISDSNKVYLHGYFD